MSKNLQTDRILYNGKPGPFYLDVEDKTDGPDGTTKPVTKDVLQEMIVANFPELQKVKDAELLNELQSVKQQQSEILDRLNEPIDTKLTGSNVEVLTDVQTTSGASSIGETQSSIPIALNYSKYKSILIYIENNHEESISFNAIDFYQKESADTSEEERIFRADGFPTTIEAGATAIYTVEDIPELAYPFGSMVLRFFAYPSPDEEEYAIIMVFGGA